MNLQIVNVQNCSPIIPWVDVQTVKRYLIRTDCKVFVVCPIWFWFIIFANCMNKILLNWAQDSDRSNCFSFIYFRPNLKCFDQYVTLCFSWCLRPLFVPNPLCLMPDHTHQLFMIHYHFIDIDTHTVVGLACLRKSIVMFTILCCGLCYLFYVLSKAHVISSCLKVMRNALWCVYMLFSIKSENSIGYSILDN